MKNVRKLKSSMKSEKGGIESVVIIVISIILVLGLVSYAVLTQVAGAKDVGDKGQIEQRKVGQMLKDPNTVTGNVVKSYLRQASTAMTVSVDSITNTDYNNVSTPPANPDVNDGAIFNMTKTYNANGELSHVTFTQINLGN